MLYTGIQQGFNELIIKILLALLTGHGNEKNQDRFSVGW
jgi:hypothetical protein